MTVQNNENKIYNYVRRIYLDDSDLKEGEVFCSECKGKGTIDNSAVSGYCPKCWGAGILDWVERIVGREPPKFNSGTSGHAYISSGITKNIQNQPVTNI